MMKGIHLFLSSALENLTSEDGTPKSEAMCSLATSSSLQRAVFLVSLTVGIVLTFCRHSFPPPQLGHADFYMTVRRIEEESQTIQIKSSCGFWIERVRANRRRRSKRQRDDCAH
ncbi:hypothetical protein KP509_29G056900 [Ceratopteris richardii]|uniref:Uncharacterized protein n=1 Tax=Ceratopteris richardii TaxID=49495 RepID=A0A8T2R881_CERRI|nr:hypothetical protein KP509_29G056900 [Ceratopteris richardii]